MSRRSSGLDVQGASSIVVIERDVVAIVGRRRPARRLVLNHVGWWRVRSHHIFRAFLLIVFFSIFRRLPRSTR